MNWLNQSIRHGSNFLLALLFNVKNGQFVFISSSSASASVYGWVKCEEPGGRSDNNSTLTINPDGLTERIGPLVTSAADENIIPAFSPTLSSDIIERWQRQIKPWGDEWEIVKEAHVSASINKICSAHWDCDGFSHVVQDSSFCWRLLIMAHCFGRSRGQRCERPCGDARLPIHSPAAGRNAWSTAHLHQGTEVIEGSQHFVLLYS